MLKPTDSLAPDACSALVHWLTTRTIEGNVRWEDLPGGLIGHVTSSMFVQFITQTTSEGQKWHVFRVHDSYGELLRTTAPASTLDTTPLSIAIEALFLTIVWGDTHLIN
jgi:hypothetical protein